MSMTETPAPAKPKRKYTRRVAAPKHAEPPAEFAGLTPTDCCEGCSEKKCVISGINVCGHPFKGGLQARQMMEPEVMRRYNKAKAALAGRQLGGP